MTNSAKNKVRTELIRFPPSPVTPWDLYRSSRTARSRSTRKNFPKERLANEEQLFLRALNSTVRDITNLKASITERVGVNEARIFDTHLMILKDPTLVDAILRRIRDEGSECAVGRA